MNKIVVTLVVAGALTAFGMWWFRRGGSFL